LCLGKRRIQRFRCVKAGRNRTRSTKIGNTGDDTTTREAAQGRIDQIEIFKRELAHLRADRVINLTESQVMAITAYHRNIIHELTARYDADASDGGRQLSLSMRIVSVIGALLLGSSVFVFFYHFWAAFNIATQTFLLCAAPTFTFAFALIVRARDRTGDFARLSAALCYSSFVLAVVILPPLWNINLGSASVLSCTIFAFVLAYEMCSRLQLCAALVGVLTYSAALITIWHGTPWWVFAERPENFFPGAAILLVIPSLISQRRYPDFAALYRIIGILILSGTCLSLASWPSLSYLVYSPRAVSAAYRVAVLAGGTAGIYIGVSRRLPEITFLSSLSLLLLIGLEACDWLLPKLPAYQFFLIMSALTIGALYVLNVLRGRVTERATGISR
jgi:Predicted membrane protein (DUF2157)